MKPRVFALALSCAFIHPSAPAQPGSSADPVLGTWALDPGASVFINREAPLAETRVYKRHERGVEVHIVTIDRQGVRHEVTYTARPDGAEHPVYGAQGAEHVTLHVAGPGRAEAVFTHGGKEVGKTVRELSREGNTMTVALTWNGNLLSRAVYRKVDDAEETGAEAVAE